MENEKYIIVSLESFNRLDALLCDVQDIVSEFRDASFDCVTIESLESELSNQRCQVKSQLSDEELSTIF